MINQHINALNLKVQVRTTSLHLEIALAYEDLTFGIFIIPTQKCQLRLILDFIEILWYTSYSLSTYSMWGLLSSTHVWPVLSLAAIWHIWSETNFLKSHW